MEVAAHVLALRCGLDPAADQADRPERRRIAFDPARRRTLVVIGRDGGPLEAAVLGAPDAVLPLCGESLNARYRRAVRAGGHFPTEQAALKCLYLVTRSLDPTGTGRTRWTMRWKPVIDAFAITFIYRWPGAETY